MKSVFAGRAGEHRRVEDLGGDARGEAEPSEVERQAVAEVDGGSGAQLLAGVHAQRQARLGVQVPLPGFALSELQAKRRASEFSRHIDFVAGPCAIAAERGSARDRAADGDVAGEGLASGQIAAGEEGAGGEREGIEAFTK